MNLVRRNQFPWPAFQPIQQAMNSVLGRGFDRVFDNYEGLGIWTPPVEVYETADTVVLVAELPGFQKDEVDISIEHNQLTLSGERKAPEGREYHRSERWYGRFERSLVLPNSIDPDGIKAQLQNGILTVTLPKRAEAKPRQIPVSVE